MTPHCLYAHIKTDSLTVSPPPGFECTVGNSFNCALPNDKQSAFNIRNVSLFDLRLPQVLSYSEQFVTSIHTIDSSEINRRFKILP